MLTNIKWGHITENSPYCVVNDDLTVFIINYLHGEDSPAFSGLNSVDGTEEGLTAVEDDKKNVRPTSNITLTSDGHESQR